MIEQQSGCWQRRSLLRLDKEGESMGQINDVSLSLLGYSRKQVNHIVEQKDTRIKGLETEVSEWQSKVAELEEKISYFESIEQALKEGILDARVKGNTIVQEATEEAERKVAQTNEQVTQFKEEFAYTSRELVGNGANLKVKMNEMKEEMLVILAAYQEMIETTDFDALYPENQVDRMVQQIDAYEADEQIDAGGVVEGRKLSPENNLSEEEKRELELLIHDVIANENALDLDTDEFEVTSHKLVDFPKAKGSN